MSWLPTFGAWEFAAAGALGAATTVLIHLLNRRRHRVLHWGAMAFLQQAAKRNRRVIQVRDAVLLALRTLAVLLFGFALARPYYGSGETISGAKPIHAILVIDNSLSMSYRALDGSLLNKAKQSAKDLGRQLPAGSSISVIAGCGIDRSVPQEPLLDLQAVDAEVDRIEIADTAASIGEMLAAAQAAAAFETNQPQQIVLFTDLQATTWEVPVGPADSAGLVPMQIVDVSPLRRENAWVAAVRVENGFAESRTTSNIYVTVARRGGNTVRQADVSLLVDEQLVGSRSVSLEAGQDSQVVTFEHTFVTNATGGVTYVPIKAAITPDRVTIDDVRHCVVPVLPQLPIVFVDQFGKSGEDVRRGKIGETRSLRRLLRSERDDDLQEIVLSPRFIALAELDSKLLEQAKIAVVAGVSTPADKVSLLRDFVEAGGQLLIAAGGEFSASAWQESAWLDGNGILPGPLTGRMIGATPDDTQGELKPFLLSFESLQKSSLLHLAGVPDESLRSLYAEPLFFKAVEVDAMPESSSVYRTVMRLDSPAGPPLVLERSVGEGRVVFYASGLSSSWNTLPLSNAVVMLDRLVREMIRSTISDRNLTAQSRIQITMPVLARDSVVLLQRPDDSKRFPLAPDYFDRENFGVTLELAYRRGVYSISAVARDASENKSEVDPIWDTEVAINGDSIESDLSKADEVALSTLAQDVALTVASSADEVSFIGTQTTDPGIWWWLAVVVLVVLVAETLTLVIAHRKLRSIREPEWAA